MEPYFWLAPLAALTALITSFVFFKFIKNKESGNETMRTIAEKIVLGAVAYLKQQFRVVAIAIIILSATLAVAAYGFHVQNEWVWIAFLSGAFFSGLCSYIGMKTATQTAPKVVQAARNSLGESFQIALRGGAIMGLIVSGFALLDISFWFLGLNFFIEEGSEAKMINITTTMLTFGMGASLQATFARIGGGIFTKAADIGADLVGKVKHHFNEDDVRNPATIADNVGDNVGDVAGMGADLYESYAGSMISAMVLGAAAATGNTANQYELAVLPMLISAIGIIASIIGIYMVKILDGDSVKQLVRTMNNGVIASSLVVITGTFLTTHLLDLNINLAYCIMVGIILGVVVGEITNYYTSNAYKPTKNIAKSAKTSDGMVMIAGLAVGMKSVFAIIIAIVISIVLAYDLGYSAGGASISYGLYGIALSSVGMLSTLGITLATDAYGPISDNAGGCAEMAHLPPEVRERTDKLDSVGNTTAAIGKGFAIGSAALTSMALLTSYIEELRVNMMRIGLDTLNIAQHSIDTATASLPQLMSYYNVDLSNKNLIIGLMLGGMLVWVFAGICLESTHKVAKVLVRNVEKQLDDPEVESGRQEPDYEACVRITTKGAQREMTIPALLGVIPPLIIGQLFGVAGVMGLMAGTLVAGVPMAIFMANSGGAWDNAKKYIEAGNYGGKGSEAHKAAITGDITGDPFKDTAGPAINIFIKLIALSSIVSAGLVSF